MQFRSFRPGRRRHCVRDAGPGPLVLAGPGPRPGRRRHGGVAERLQPAHRTTQTPTRCYVPLDIEGLSILGRPPSLVARTARHQTDRRAGTGSERGGQRRTSDLASARRSGGLGRSHRGRGIVPLRDDKRTGRHSLPSDLRQCALDVHATLTLIPTDPLSARAVGEVFTFSRKPRNILGWHAEGADSVSQPPSRMQTQMPSPTQLNALPLGNADVLARDP
jgi:hypothetical protein